MHTSYLFCDIFIRSCVAKLNIQFRYDRRWYFCYYFKALLWQVFSYENEKRPAYSSFLLFKLCCQCVSMLHSRSGQWSEPDSPDGLALMGALPVQHRLWQRPGVLHRREFVQTGQWRCILSSEQCITHIPRVSADGRYAGHWRLQGGWIRHGYNRRLLAWS